MALHKQILTLTTDDHFDVLEREIRRRFDVYNATVIQNLGRFITPDGIDMVSLEAGFAREIKRFSAEMANVFLYGAQLTAEDISVKAGERVVFNPTATASLTALTTLQRQVYDGLVQQQAEALLEMRRLHLQVVPIRNFAEVRETVTLTARQQRAVANYRRLLETNSPQSLDRLLRDRRFDPTVQRAIDTAVPLTPEQVDRMVSRYISRQLDYRAKTIAATEAVRIANESDKTFYQQWIESGDVKAEDLSRKWITSKDEKVRTTHRSLNDVVRNFDEPWVSTSGAILRFPGDPSAPLDEIIHCRCWVETKINYQSKEQSNVA